MAALTVPFHRLSRLARTMQVVTTVGIVLFVVLMTLCFVIPDWTRNLLLARLGHVGAQLPVTPEARAVAAAVLLLPVGLMIYGLLAVRALFGEFATGRVFTEGAARHLQVFGFSVLAQAPLGPLTSVVLSLAVSMMNESGQRMGALSFSLHDYFALIVGGVLLAIATVMREAARLADENATFV